jgi:hypothetical protein
MFLNHIKFVDAIEFMCLVNIQFFHVIIYSDYRTNLYLPILLFICIKVWHYRTFFYYEWIRD